jgi:hypothetical protein
MKRRWVKVTTEHMSTLSGKKTLNRNLLKYQTGDVRKCGLVTYL